MGEDCVGPLMSRERGRGGGGKQQAQWIGLDPPWLSWPGSVQFSPVHFTSSSARSINSPSYPPIAHPWTSVEGGVELRSRLARLAWVCLFLSFLLSLRSSFQNNARSTPSARTTFCFKKGAAIMTSPCRIVSSHHGHSALYWHSALASEDALDRGKSNSSPAASPARRKGRRRKEEGNEKEGRRKGEGREKEGKRNGS